MGRRRAIRSAKPQATDDVGLQNDVMGCLRFVSGEGESYLGNRGGALVIIPGSQPL